MKFFNNLIFTSLTLLSLNTFAAADFTVQFTPADASVTDAKVNDVTIAKVTGLQAILDALAKLTDLVPYAKTTDLSTYAKLTDIAPLTPTGTVASFAGSVVPTGWLLTDGSGVSTTTYAKLFAVIGYTYGGSGATFNLPNTQGMFIRGTGYQAWNGIGYNGTLAQRQNDQMQGHAHNVRIGGDGAIAGGTSAQRTVNTFTAGTTYNILDDGHGAPRVGYETQPANISMYYMIKY